MYNADRVYETSTTSGAITTSSVITVGGAFASNYQTFQNRVKVGDPCHVTIVDAGASVWIDFEGTLTTTTTITIDTIEDSSAGLGTGVTLTAGTHKVLLSFGAFQANKHYITADGFIDHVVSGLVPPTSANLTSIMTAGVCYVSGQRVKKGAQSKTYTASKDTYVDISNTGTITYVEVSNGAAAGALTANSIRVAKVVSSGSAVTSVVTTGTDSLGNNIHNTVREPSCVLADGAANTNVTGAGTVVAIPFGAGTETFTNDGMHSTVTNNTRCTIQHAGLYSITGSLQIGNVATAGGAGYGQANKNGTGIPGAAGYTNLVVGSYANMNFSTVALLAVNDYVELACQQYTGVTQNIDQGYLQVVRIG